MALRYLRIIEYVYENEERAAQDMARWTNSLTVKGMTMRSATLTMESVPWIDEPTPGPSLVGSDYEMDGVVTTNVEGGPCPGCGADPGMEHGVGCGSECDGTIYSGDINADMRVWSEPGDDEYEQTAQAMQRVMAPHLGLPDRSGAVYGGPGEPDDLEVPGFERPYHSHPHLEGGHAHENGHLRHRHVRTLDGIDANVDILGRPCPQCGNPTVVYNGNYFCAELDPANTLDGVRPSADCGWAFDARTADARPWLQALVETRKAKGQDTTLLGRYLARLDGGT